MINDIYLFKGSEPRDQTYYIDVEHIDIYSFNIIVEDLIVSKMSLIDIENSIVEVGFIDENGKGYFNRNDFFKDTYLNLILEFKDSVKVVTLANIIYVNEGYLTVVRPTNLRAVYNTYSNIENFKGEYIESIDETNYIDVDSSNQCG